MRLVRSGLRLLVGLSFLALPTATSLIRPAAAADKSPDPKRPYGLEKRVLWTTSRVQGSPDPASPFHTEPAFPKLKFDEPIAMAHAPGSDRVFVLQRFGKLLSFPNDPTVEKTELVLDVKKEVLGLALHPEFEKNGYVFIASLTVAADAQPRTVRVSRFKVDPGESPRSDAKSELVLIEWPSLYHDGGCLAFGRDGYLYISAGDGGGARQRAGAGRPVELHPADRRRPCRREIGRTRSRPTTRSSASPGPGRRSGPTACGNPWRFSIDRATGDLWAGDVGQDLWEMVYLVRRGGNYGWNVREGNHPYQPWQEAGADPHPAADRRAQPRRGPVDHRRLCLPRHAAERPHRRLRLRRLRHRQDLGARGTTARRSSGTRRSPSRTYRIVGIRRRRRRRALPRGPHGGQRSTDWSPLRHRADPSDFPAQAERDRPVCVDPRPPPRPGPDPLRRECAALVRRRRQGTIPGPPRRLEDRVRRHLLPRRRDGPGPHGWKFPDGTVLVKTFFLDLEKGNPARRIRLETRLLHHRRLVGTEEVGDQFWRGYTYIWNDDQTDATLLENPNGLDRTYTIRDPTPRGAPGGRPGTSPAAPNACSATRCRPSSSSASTRCR